MDFAWLTPSSWPNLIFQTFQTLLNGHVILKSITIRPYFTRLMISPTGHSGLDMRIGCWKTNDRTWGLIMNLPAQ